MGRRRARRRPGARLELRRRPPAREQLLARGAGAVRLRGGRAALHLRRVAAARPPDAALPHRRREDRPARRGRARRARAARAPALGRPRERPDAVVVGSGPERARRGGRARAGRRVGAGARGHATRSAAARAPPSSRCPASSTTSAPACIRWAILSPFLRTLPLDEHGLRWIRPRGLGRASARRRAGGAAAALARRHGRASSAPTRDAYARLLDAVSARSARPARRRARRRSASRAIRCCMLRFGLARRCARRSAWRARFRGPRARGAVRRLRGALDPAARRALTGAVGLMFLLTGARRRLAGRRAAARSAIAARARELPARARRPHRDRRARALAGRAAAGARLPVRHQPRAARRHRRTGAAGRLRAPPAALSLRAGRVQARLGARRPDPVDAIRAASRPRPCTSAARSKRSPPPRPRCGAASTPSGPFVLVCPAEPVRSDAARRPASTPATRTATCRPARRSISPR